MLTHSCKFHYTMEICLSVFFLTEAFVFSVVVAVDSSKLLSKR